MRLREVRVRYQDDAKSELAGHPVDVSWDLCAINLDMVSFIAPEMNTLDQTSIVVGGENLVILFAYEAFCALVDPLWP